ncbi:hypothetical protein J5N97_013698 [Dioscorea zingiberensis]|uniref:Protein THYLAKOID ASSEMBLY 8, chloroplastic n=1 Tax=Dioscorea zingiberensis TaxID=325984 RepID=A0A9D5CSR4_9LILI|nr:hypothetical protein J5N97_013698 [Dioscorea zingiberensis]
MMAAASSAVVSAPLLLRFPKRSLNGAMPTLSPITCGPRDNRGPMIRGRTLSTEAILAIQALKRASGDEAKIDAIISGPISRLIKSDLLASLAELQRQDKPQLALKVFLATRRELWYRPDPILYAQMVSALSRNRMGTEIDVLVSDLIKEQEGKNETFMNDIRGIARLVKALLAAGKGEAVKEIYGLMKRGGCQPDEYLFRLLIRGLRRLGEMDAADEVERDFKVWFDGGVGAEPFKKPVADNRNSPTPLRIKENISFPTTAFAFLPSFSLGLEGIISSVLPPPQPPLRLRSPGKSSRTQNIK